MRRPPLHSLLLSIAAVALPSCEVVPPGVSAPSDDTVVVELLDAHFVRVDGRRQPWEGWIYDMRQRCRACADAASIPWVRFKLVGDDVTRDVVQRMQHELRASGVSRIELEGP